MNPDWRDAFRLDGDAGPAAPLSVKQTKERAAGAVESALAAHRASVMTRTVRGLLVVAGIGGILGGLTFAASPRNGQPPCAGSACDESSDFVTPKAAAIPSTTEAAAATALPATIAVIDEDHPTIPAERTPSEPAPAESLSVAHLPDAPGTPALTAEGATVGTSAKRLEPSRSTNRPSRNVSATEASDMLAEANRLRGQKEWARAAELYARVMNSAADESYTATIALASLRLEHEDDPRGALALYERALSARPNGPLSSQAKSGAARCRRALSKNVESPDFDGASRP